MGRHDDDKDYYLVQQESTIVLYVYGTGMLQYGTQEIAHIPESTLMLFLIK
jgi:hypothetical protein